MKNSRLRIVSAAALTVVGATSVTAQATAPPRDALPLAGVVTNPDWVSKPSGDVVGRYFPRLALALGLPGRAMMTCEVSTLGTVHSCAVTSEVPRGMGFGAAALAMAPLFRMRPKTLDGAPVAGAKVNIPFRFSAQQAPASEGPKQASADSQGLARRLVEAEGDVSATLDRSRKALEEFQASLVRQGAADADSPEGKLALAALLRALMADSDRPAGQAAMAYAETMTEAQMRAALAFLKSPAGQALTKGRAAANQAVSEGIAGFMGQVRRDAQIDFCRQVRCVPADAPAPPPAPQPQRGKP